MLRYLVQTQIRLALPQRICNMCCGCCCFQRKLTYIKVLILNIKGCHLLLMSIWIMFQDCLVLTWYIFRLFWIYPQWKAKLQLLLIGHKTHSSLHSDTSSGRYSIYLHQKWQTDSFKWCVCTCKHFSLRDKAC